MPKTKEELNVLKQEYQALTIKLQELSEEELRLVTGGINHDEHNVFMTGSGSNDDPVKNGIRVN